MSANRISWMVGGQQGEGIDSVGEMFAAAMNKLGYYLYGQRNFSSRIKGGNTTYHVSVSTQRIYHAFEGVDVLLAFDQDTVDGYTKELKPGGYLIIDKALKAPESCGDKSISVHAVPFRELAAIAGNPIMKNMVALGVSAAILNLQEAAFIQYIREKFADKGEAVINGNIAAFRSGIAHVQDSIGAAIRLAPAKAESRLFMSGNQALAIGALAAGCRFMAGYPITPASEVLENFISLVENFGGTVVQTEDEIAAVTMITGAAYAGARAMTATSGPGLSLMQEGIGLAAITEVPIVIIDNQRSGPSSGMATKHEQSDLFAMIGGTHGDADKIVLAPATAEDCFGIMFDAFNLAETFQCPVLIASDLTLAMSKQTCEAIDLSKYTISRGKRLRNDELPATNNEQFRRYEITEDGVSPRPVPGQRGGVHHVTGIEHSLTGHPSENPQNRVRMVDKRHNKLKNVGYSRPFEYEGEDRADVLLIGFGSTFGPIRETARLLAKEGVRAGHLHLRLLHPLPVEKLKPYLDSASKIIVAENNSTGQLAAWLKQHFAIHVKTESLLQYDGLPFTTSTIAAFCKEVLA